MKKKHYRTAFFEAFPKNPSCFLRGQGETIEEAEEACWKKYQKIINCKDHDFERRTRTDGYCYCKNCPLQGKFLDPSTKCSVCNIPTSIRLFNNTNKCINHYLTSELSEIIDPNDTYTSVEEQEIYFTEDQLTYQELLKYNYVINDKSWEKISDDFIQIKSIFSLKYKPFFGDPLKSDKEIHELFKKEIPSYVCEYLKQKKIKK